MPENATPFAEDVRTPSSRPAMDAEPSKVRPTSPEICVICLDRVSEKATILPCGHDHFDFLCLGTWSQQQLCCPLCKRDIQAIKYADVNKGKESHIYTFASQDHFTRTTSGVTRRLDRSTRRYSHFNPYSQSGRTCRRNNQRHHESQTESTLVIRRRVYREGLYSLHVGTNSISRYRNITPSSFRSDDQLVARAKAFVRRELAVFDFLNPSSSSFESTSRRASNAEFLLEYIISILKSIDLKASTGQAEELLKDFLGRSNARLFLHELHAWLRSPYEKLANWDIHVQYDRARADDHS